MRAKHLNWTKQRLAVMRVLQQHPELMKDTNLLTLASKVADTLGDGNTVINVKLILTRLINQSVLRRTAPYGKQRVSTFWINYYLPKLPKEVMDNMPQDERERVEMNKKKAEDRMAEIDDEGITTIKLSSGADPLNEDVEGEPAEIIEPEPEPEPEKNSISPLPAPIENTPQQISVPVELKRDGQNLSITININLNI